MSEEGAARGVIAERLQRLWEIRPASLRDVADAITAETGREVSAQYLSQLRNGQRTEPSYSIIAAIATYFGVTPDYFRAPDDIARQTEESSASCTPCATATSAPSPCAPTACPPPASPPSPTSSATSANPRASRRRQPPRQEAE